MRVNSPGAAPDAGGGTGTGLGSKDETGGGDGGVSGGDIRATSDAWNSLVNSPAEPCGAAAGGGGDAGGWLNTGSESHEGCFASGLKAGCPEPSSAGF
jgi:hypothetical protein